jgi:hypothetical protein
MTLIATMTRIPRCEFAVRLSMRPFFPELSDPLLIVAEQLPQQVVTVDTQPGRVADHQA